MGLVKPKLARARSGRGVRRLHAQDAQQPVRECIHVDMCMYMCVNMCIHVCTHACMCVHGQSKEAVQARKCACAGVPLPFNGGDALHRAVLGVVLVRGPVQAAGILHARMHGMHLVHGMDALKHAGCDTHECVCKDVHRPGLWVTQRDHS